MRAFPERPSHGDEPELEALRERVRREVAEYLAEQGTPMKTSEQRKARSFMDASDWPLRNAIEIQARATYGVFSANQPNAPAWERITEAEREAWRNVAQIPPVYKCPECKGKLRCADCGHLCP